MLRPSRWRMRRCSFILGPSISLRINPSIPRSFATSTVPSYSSNSAANNLFAGSLIVEHDEGSDSDLYKHTDLTAQSDVYILLNRLDMGLQTGMITSSLILENVKLLLEAGVTVPISFLYDSGRLLILMTASSHSTSMQAILFFLSSGRLQDSLIYRADSRNWLQP